MEIYLITLFQALGGILLTALGTALFAILLALILKFTRRALGDIDPLVERFFRNGGR